MSERKKRSSGFIKRVLAIIIKPFVYKNYKGAEINVPKNTPVYVDVEAGVALVGLDHVDIAREEYRTINN